MNIITKVNQIKLDNSIKKNNPNIYHATSNMYNVAAGIKKVVTIHDCIPEAINELQLNNQLPSYFNFNEWKSIPFLLNEKEKQLNNSDRIIAISENTKKDILRFYPYIDLGKINVIYHGGITDCNIQNISLPDKYILYVGTRKNYKNFQVLIEAFEIIIKNDPNIYLVCVGGGTFTREEQLDFLQKSVTRKIFHYNDVNDKILNYIYQNASLFVFPSLYEGFGIPILEAFQNNCPVILSNSSCFPEIAQDAAVYFNMLDKDDLVDKIGEILYDKETQNLLKKLGKMRVKDFSWKKSSDEHHQLYNSL